MKDAEFLGKHKVGKVDFCLKSTFPGAWEEEQQWNCAKGGEGGGGGEFLHQDPSSLTRNQCPYL